MQREVAISLLLRPCQSSDTSGRQRSSVSTGSVRRRKPRTARLAAWRASSVEIDCTQRMIFGAEGASHIRRQIHEHDIGAIRIELPVQLPEFRTNAHQFQSVSLFETAVQP